jgi:hypothetical protein
MYLVRIALVFLIIYLIVRAFLKLGEEDKGEKRVRDAEKKSAAQNKKVSKAIGEYVEYEEIKKKS